MRLVLFDRPTPERIQFYPLALSRPIWELRCGMTSLADKLVAQRLNKWPVLFHPIWPMRTENQLPGRSTT
jgi:hypothetical protein